MIQFGISGIKKIFQVLTDWTCIVLFTCWSTEAHAGLNPRQCLWIQKKSQSFWKRRLLVEMTHTCVAYADASNKVRLF